MSNNLQDRSRHDRSGWVNTPAKFSPAHAAGEQLLTDAAKAQTWLDIAESAREPARAYGSIARACRALVHINQCLRTLELDADTREGIEKARNGLRLRLAQLDTRVTRH